MSDGAQSITLHVYRADVGACPKTNCWWSNDVESEWSQRATFLIWKSSRYCDCKLRLQQSIVWWCICFTRFFSVTPKSLCDVLPYSFMGTRLFYGGIVNALDICIIGVSVWECWKSRHENLVNWPEPKLPRFIITGLNGKLSMHCRSMNFACRRLAWPWIINLALISLIQSG